MVPACGPEGDAGRAGRTGIRAGMERMGRYPDPGGDGTEAQVPGGRPAVLLSVSDGSGGGECAENQPKRGDEPAAAGQNHSQEGTGGVVSWGMS